MARGIRRNPDKTIEQLLADIPMPVYLWHGEADAICPINMGRYVAKSIPDCRAKFYPQEGHLSLIVNHYEELLSATVS